MNIRRTTRSRAAILLLVVLMVGSTVSAHHGEAGAYVLNETIKLSGVVKEVRWGNPHIIIAIDVKGARGADQWSVELSSITTTEEAGGTRDSVAAGETIVVTGHPHRTNKLLILPRSIQKPDGSTAIPVPIRRGIFGTTAPQR